MTCATRIVATPGTQEQGNQYNNEKYVLCSVRLVTGSVSCFRIYDFFCHFILGLDRKNALQMQQKNFSEPIEYDALEDICRVLHNVTNLRDRNAALLEMLTHPGQRAVCRMNSLSQLLMHVSRETLSRDEISRSAAIFHPQDVQ